MLKTKKLKSRIGHLGAGSTYNKPAPRKGIYDEKRVIWNVINLGKDGWTDKEEEFIDSWVANESEERL